MIGDTIIAEWLCQLQNLAGTIKSWGGLYGISTALVHLSPKTPKTAFNGFSDDLKGRTFFLSLAPAQACFITVWWIISFATQGALA